ncbi:MAG TPA: PepSY-associated TM helix domain-containing protein, partial [Mycobacteriales bacterium]|nr:PepSY-associated TM helix domain-containing protein [Mycobacteriales bacterium]
MGVHLTGVRLLLLRLHFYAGLLVGPFVLIAALTGLLYTVAPTLDSAVYARELRVPVGAHPVPLSEQVANAQAAARVAAPEPASGPKPAPDTGSAPAAEGTPARTSAQSALPDDAVLAVRPAARPDASTRVVFATAPGQAERTVFVDPYTGQVLGTLSCDGDLLPIQAWVGELHRTLYLGGVGRLYSELASTWLLVLAVSGTVLWTARTRRARTLRRLLVPDNGKRGRRRLQSWHGVVGLWAVIGLLLVSGTGLAWTRFAGANVTAIHAALHWTEPTVHAGSPSDALDGAGARRSAAGGDAGVVSKAAGAQRALDAVRDSGMTGPVEIRPAQHAGDAWVVQQTQRSWPTRLDQAAVDPVSGAVVQRIRFADWPFPVKLARWTADMHAGLLFGVANRVLLAVLALGVICLVVWGYRMWWLRGRRRSGWAPAPGAV